LGTTTGQLFMVTGRTDLMFRWGIVASSITVLSFVAGLPWGIRGVALSYAGAMALLIYPLFFISLRLIQLSFIELWKAIQPITFATMLMALVVFSIEFFLKRASSANLLIFCIPVGIITYAALISIVAPQLLGELKAIATAIFRIRRAD
jgi:Polysaccharide biosynthesis C-terminal domain